MKEKENAVVYEIVGRIYESHADETIINPVWLASEAMSVIGASREYNAVWWLAAHLQFRQIARSFCQQKFDPVEAVADDTDPPPAFVGAGIVWAATMRSDAISGAGPIVSTYR